MTSAVKKSLEDFFSQFRLVHYQENEILFGAQDIPPGVFYLKKGFVRQFITSENGSELTIHIFEPGSHFPMTWALNGIANSYYYQTLTPSEVFIGPKEETLKFFRKDKEASFEFSKRLLAGLNGLSKRLEGIVFGNAYSRVISTLIYLAAHLGKRVKKGILINHNFTHQDLAFLTGITRERTSLEMEKLQKKGLIINHHHTIIIPNLSYLESEMKTATRSKTLLAEIASTNL